MNSTTNLIRGVLLSGGGMFIALLGGVITLKLITNTPSLDASAVGIYAIITVAAEFLLIACNLGMRSALPKLLAASPLDERSRLIRASLWYQGAICLVLLAVVLVPWILIRNPAVFSDSTGWQLIYPYLWAVPFLVLSSAFREVLLAILAGVHEYVRRAIGLAVFALAQVFFVAVFVWLPGTHLGALLLVTIAAHAAAAAYLYAAMPTTGWPRRDWPPFCAMIRFGWPLHINALLGFVFQRIDTLLVGLLLGPAAAALFELGAKRIPQYVSGVLNAALVPYLPSLAHRLACGDHTGAGRLLDQAYSTFSFLGYAAVFAAISFNEPIICLLLSEQYVASGLAFAWVMTAFVLNLQSGIMGYSLVALGKPKWITAINMFAAGISLLMNVVLVPRYGMLGAAYTAAGVAAFSQLLQAVLVRRSGLSLPWRVYARPHTLVLLCAGPLLMAPNGFIWPVLAGLEFAILSLITGLIRIEYLTKMFRALRDQS